MTLKFYSQRGNHPNVWKQDEETIPLLWNNNCLEWTRTSPEVLLVAWVSA